MCLIIENECVTPNLNLLVGTVQLRGHNIRDPYMNSPIETVQMRGHSIHFKTLCCDPSSEPSQ